MISSYLCRSQLAHAQPVIEDCSKKITERQRKLERDKEGKKWIENKRDFNRKINRLRERDREKKLERLRDKG